MTEERKGGVTLLIITQHSATNGYFCVKLLEGESGKEGIAFTSWEPVGAMIYVEFTAQLGAPLGGRRCDAEQQTNEFVGH